MPSQGHHLPNNLLIITLMKLLMAVFFLKLVALRIGVDPTSDFSLQSHKAAFPLNDNRFKDPFDFFESS